MLLLPLPLILLAFSAAIQSMGAKVSRMGKASSTMSQPVTMMVGMGSLRLRGGG